MTAGAQQVKVNETQQQIGTLEESRRTRGEKIAQTKSKQRGYMIAARVNKDPKAQKEIDLCAAELLTLSQQDELDYAALTQLEERLESERTELERLQWREDTRAVARLVKARKSAAIEEKIKRQAAGLADLLAEGTRLDKEVEAALRGLGSQFISTAVLVQALAERRKDSVAAQLRRVLETPLSSMYLDSIARSSMKERADSLFDRALEELGADEEEPEEPAGKTDFPNHPERITSTGDGARLADVPKGVTTTAGGR